MYNLASAPSQAPRTGRSHRSDTEFSFLCLLFSAFIGNRRRRRPTGIMTRIMPGRGDIMTTQGMQRFDSTGNEISTLLRSWSEGDQEALKKLTPIVYDELHRLARRYMKQERPGHSLQTTALVNEAYTRLVDYRRMQWQDRAHFFAVSAQVMRRILVDYARRHNLKRGAGVQQVSLEQAAVIGGDESTGSALDFAALDDALNALARIDL